jgi:aminoglycoside phosphotransferase (APT) family kinase protein
VTTRGVRHEEAVTAIVQNATRSPVAAERLTEVLDRHGIGAGGLEVTLIGDGHSNITCLLRRDDGVSVLRRPPWPPYAPSAHNVLREARIIAALADTPVPVPRILLTCDDESVLGAPFYLMEHLDGVVLSDTTPAALDTEPGRSAIADAVVDALVAIHSVDPDGCGLGQLAPRDGYLTRQLRRFTQMWDAVRTREIQLVGELARWLAEHRPESRENTLVHGDFRVGNVLIATDPPARVLGVLDWEMATLGDPLADLGYLVATYADGTPGTVMSELTPVTQCAGYPDRAGIVRRYEARSGRSAEGLRWYEAFGLWKSAIFLEASYRRYLNGATDDPWFASFGTRLPELAEAAWELTR